MSKSCLPSAALTSPTRAFTVGWSNSDRQSLGACDGAVLDRAIADHRIGQVHVFDLGLQLAAVLFGDLAAEDDSDLVRLADGPVDVEQAFAQFVERRRKIRLSQNSIWEKNRRCWHPACLRSLAVKNGVKRASHFWPQVDRSSAVKASASSWRRSGLPHLRKALEHCWKSTPSSRMRFASGSPSR